VCHGVILSVESEESQLQGDNVAGKVLLVDDSAMAQSMGRQILTEGGYTVETAGSANEATARLAEFQPDVLVLDAVMQGGPAGLEMCGELRANSALVTLPVVLTGGAMDSIDAEDATEAGADSFVLKPFEATELLARVREAEELAGRRERPQFEMLRAPAPPTTAPQIWPAEVVAKFFGTSSRSAPSPQPIFSEKESSTSSTVHSDAQAISGDISLDIGRLEALLREALAAEVPAIADRLARTVVAAIAKAQNPRGYS
jgi:DNA-binding response OmpR family regulator